MEALMMTMMVWISIHTGFEVTAAPSIVYLSPVQVKRYAFGCDQQPVPEGNEDACNNDVASVGTPKALYDHETKTILLIEEFKPGTILANSVLLHELVHHLQYHNGYDKKVECQGKLEEQAYQLQDRWLFTKYHTNVWDVVGLGKLLYHIIISCDDLYH